MAIEISTPQDWKDINNDLTADYILTSDIDFGGANIDGIGVESDTEFTGTLDGNFHTISNYVINYDTLGCLFWIIGQDGVVEKLTIDNGVPQSGSYNGIIAGRVTNNGIIRNCKVMNTESYTSGGANWVGIFASRLDDSSLIENCFGAEIYATDGDIDGSVGGVTSDSAVESNTFYVDNCDMNDNGYGTPLTDTEAKTAQTYIDAGWDTSIWDLQDGSYPVLGQTAQEESGSANLDLGVEISSQIIPQEESGSESLELGIDIGSQLIPQLESNSESLELGIEIGSQTIENIKTGSASLELGIDISSQTIPVYSNSALLAVGVEILAQGKQRIDLVSTQDLNARIDYTEELNSNINYTEKLNALKEYDIDLTGNIE